jgi:enhancing lycopene biosynthesis protein 2
MVQVFKCPVFRFSMYIFTDAPVVQIPIDFFQIVFFAPNKTQHHAINHINGEEDEQV